MTANELADELERMIPALPLKALIKSATMLRQQAQEIEALKEKLELAEWDEDAWKKFKQDNYEVINLGHIICDKCNNTGWVCERHPDKEAHKCCGGAGMPCECTKESE